jgi:hypothetical protein
MPGDRMVSIPVSQGNNEAESIQVGVISSALKSRACSLDECGNNKFDGQGEDGGVVVSMESETRKLSLREVASKSDDPRTYERKRRRRPWRADTYIHRVERRGSDIDYCRW